MDDLNKGAEDEDKDFKNKGKMRKIPSFGFKEHNKSGLPVPVSQSGPKNGRPLSISQRPSTPKFRKKNVIQPEPVITKKSTDKISLNRFGFHGNPPLNFSNKVADMKQNSEDAAVRVKINSLTAAEPVVEKAYIQPAVITNNNNNKLKQNQQSEHANIVRPSTGGGLRTKTGIPSASPARLTLHSSHLPRPQLPIKLGRNIPAPSTTPLSSLVHGSPEKHAKMLANNEAKARSRSCPKTRDTSSNLENCNRFGYKTQNDAIEVTEMIPLPTFRNRSLDLNSATRRNQNLSFSAHMDRSLDKSQIETSSSSDEEDSLTHGEEKLNKDILGNEKSAIKMVELRCDQLWNEGEGNGEGEALAMDLLPDGSYPDDLGVQTGVDKPLRSVLLTIEDQAFAVLAALSSSELIENETSPDLMLSISPPVSESHDLPSSKPTSLSLGKSSNSGTGSPCTPTHGPSNSLSICSDERDYFDDEIADQPGLVFDDDDPVNSSIGPLSSSLTEETVTVLDNNNRNAQSYAITTQRENSVYGSHSSMSPCASVASDDLILDYDRNDSQSYTASFSFELQHDSRFRNSLRASNSTIQSNFTSGSESQSPCSAISFSPFRSSSTNSNINSSLESSFSDSGIRLDQNTYQHLFQDVISIKTMLLRLKRVLSLNGQQYNISSPSIKYYNNDQQDQVMDLKRQLILLQQEMEEKNRKICILETQVEKYNENVPITLSRLEKITSATQTERIKN